MLSIKPKTRITWGSITKTERYELRSAAWDILASGKDEDDTVLTLIIDGIPAVLARIAAKQAKKSMEEIRMSTDDGHKVKVKVEQIERVEFERKENGFPGNNLDRVNRVKEWWTYDIPAVLGRKRKGKDAEQEEPVEDIQGAIGDAVYSFVESTRSMPEIIAKGIELSVSTLEMRLSEIPGFKSIQMGALVYESVPAPVKSSGYAMAGLLACYDPARGGEYTESYPFRILDGIAYVQDVRKFPDRMFAVNIDDGLVYALRGIQGAYSESGYYLKFTIERTFPLPEIARKEIVSGRGIKIFTEYVQGQEFMRIASNNGLSIMSIPIA